MRREEQLQPAERLTCNCHEMNDEASGAELSFHPVSQSPTVSNFIAFSQLIMLQMGFFVVLFFLSNRGLHRERSSHRGGVIVWSKETV